MCHGKWSWVVHGWFEDAEILELYARMNKPPPPSLKKKIEKMAPLVYSLKREQYVIVLVSISTVVYLAWHFIDGMMKYIYYHDTIICTFISIRNRNQVRGTWLSHLCWNVLWVMHSEWYREVLSKFSDITARETLFW